jgi:hypothetical protein
MLADGALVSELGPEDCDGTGVDEGNDGEDAWLAVAVGLACASFLDLPSPFTKKNVVTPAATSSATTIAAISGALLLPGLGGCGP